MMKKFLKSDLVCFTKSFCVPKSDAVTIISYVPFAILFVAPILYYTFIH